MGKYTKKYGNNNTLKIITDEDNTQLYKTQLPNEDCAGVYDIINSKLVKKYYRFRNIFKRCAMKLDVPVILYIEAEIKGTIRPVPLARLNKITKNIVYNLIEGQLIFDMPISREIMQLSANNITLFDMININNKFPYLINISAGEHEQSPLLIPLLLGECYLIRTKSVTCRNYPASGTFPGADLYSTEEVFGIVIKRDSVLFDVLAANHAYWTYDFKGVEDTMGDEFKDHRITISEARKQFKEMIDI